ncbi:uncharacterized protein LOC109847410 [Asparagus officinalis]|uniref:uncharacterized protein LOC109847410 n=1 Tax=Asparagus officinalis TaxID=4686 RepID=UPI00098E72CA|nr:uncharacterized protein LOC109847410 [Asparagus officinalis]
MRQGGVNSFVHREFRGWNKKSRLEAHVRKCGSAHNVAIHKRQDLMKQPQFIQSAFDRQTEEAQSEYRVCLETSIDCFAHNEKVNSVILSNAPVNYQMVASSIQKDIVYVAKLVKETCNAIITEVGDDFVGILMDESANVSCKEQMAATFHYVDERGFLMERSIGIVHNHFDTNDFFDVLGHLLNVVGGSCKRRDKIREKKAEQIAKSLQIEEFESGRGLKQEMALKKPTDTHGGSHYRTLLNLMEKLLKMTEFYPYEFSVIEILALKNQLDNYIVDVHRDAMFANLKGISDLSKKVAETKKHNVYPLVYLLLKMALTLLMATTSIERAFYAIKLIKNRLRNKMSDA